MFGLSTHRDGHASEEATAEGILTDHEYSMVRLIDLAEQGLPLLCQVRNPWGKVKLAYTTSRLHK